jgi:hypothetical protein
VDLFEYQLRDSSWHEMASGPVSSGPSGKKIFAGAHKRCKWIDWRQWRMQSYAAWVFPDEQWDGYHRGRREVLGCTA